MTTSANWPHGAKLSPAQRDLLDAIACNDVVYCVPFRGSTGHGLVVSGPRYGETVGTTRTFDALERRGLIRVARRMGVSSYHVNLAKKAR